MPPDSQPRRPARPRRGENRHATRERLVRSGLELLTEKGFASTGLDEVLRRSGVPKGSFYHYFASKEDFGRAVIAAYAAYFARKLDRHLLDASRPPLDRLRGFVADGKAGMRRHGFRRGCLVGNLGQELGATHDGFRDALEAVLLDWQGKVARCLEAARDRGEIAADADCARLAALFWIGWEGAVLRAKLVRDVTPIDLFVDHFIAGLDR